LQYYRRNTRFLEPDQAWPVSFFSELIEFFDNRPISSPWKKLPHNFARRGDDRRG
jgi:hypothetical protein